MESLEQFKKLLSKDNLRIELYEFLHQRCSEAIQSYSNDELERLAKRDASELKERLEYYEQKSSDLITVMALLGFWGSTSHRRLVSLHARHFNQFLAPISIHDPAASLQWYPLLLQQYALGLGSVASNSFEVLHEFLQWPFTDSRSGTFRTPQALAISSWVARASDLFKILPEHKKHFTPISEYLFGLFGTALEGTLFFGNDYEYHFDRFEILLALQHAHLNSQLHEGNYWAPIGRFGWKFRRGGDQNPYSHLCQEASNARDSWVPIRAGFFAGDFARFEEVASNYAERLNRLGWY